MFFHPKNQLCVGATVASQCLEYLGYITLATGYYRVNYDEENWRDLTTTLKKYGDSRINRLNRAALVDDIMNLARSGKVDYDLALDLLLYLKMENDYIPWEAAFR